MVFPIWVCGCNISLFILLNFDLYEIELKFNIVIFFYYTCNLQLLQKYFNGNVIKLFSDIVPYIMYIDKLQIRFN